MGAAYLLALVVAAEPRGLPGTVIERVAFQRAAEGHPLDDVIVHAHDALGRPATLEIQVKRGLTFAPQDAVFHSVIEQIARASSKPEFQHSRHEMAIAVSRTSQKIDGAYQDVLTWARQMGDAATFMSRINRPAVGSDDKRSFVDTFRTQFARAGLRDDDETLWSVLRRVQILRFDFTAPGSAEEVLARERAARALDAAETPRAAELFTALTAIALQAASAGGDRTRTQLRDELRALSFRLAGDRNLSPVRKALKEAADHALADIGDYVANVSIPREERVNEVREALDRGRYVEIRGDAGVGKSAMMKYLAAQIATEAQVMVLSPSRIAPRGWTAMRGELGFDGSARELLSDMACAGGAILFVDNLDFYGEEERRTVNDLVREAMTISGFSVVATARSGFGEVEPSWLDNGALDRMGRAEPVVISELSDAEIGELSEAAPQLAALLAEGHPAKSVARNLFRLARLASLSAAQNVPRTEIEMATQWWETADGAFDAGHRDRTRALTSLAVQSLSSVEPLIVSQIPAIPIDALIESETLRDLGNDKVTFRHDVLRDWAIANLLFADNGRIDAISLDRPVPTSLMRGIELAARMMVERNSDGSGWASFLGALSRPGAHGSWRRMALLALVRSEIAGQVLDRAAGELLRDRAQLLRELIRVVRAVEAEPAAKRLARLGLDANMTLRVIQIPIGLSWSRLIGWLSNLGSGLPAAALPEVVDLYSAWCFAFLGRDAATPTLVRWFYYWLSQIQNAGRERPFNDELTSQELSTLASGLTTGFLMFCDRTPDLASQYLEKLRENGTRFRRGLELPKFRGSLARAVPKEFAEFTADALLSKAGEDSGGPFREPFGYQDLDFIPISPAQGPFLELLSAGPEHGLKLIRRVVDHEISWKSGGRAFGADEITIRFQDGSERVYPWIRSYNWSRDVGAASAITTSALMALEAWAHGRIEAGDRFEEVLDAVLGTALAPTAYLLVGVDLILSHPEKSRSAAIPYLGCPELLCLDRERQMHDVMPVPDIFGLKALQKEPIGAATLDSLKARLSRRLSLEQLIGAYALDGAPENREALMLLLRKAAQRLGPPNDESTLGDPEFMVVHALNLVDPNNWRKRPLRTKAGDEEGWEYVSPDAEAGHLRALQDASRDQHANAAMQTNVKVALYDPSRSSPAFAEAAVNWARESGPQFVGLDETQQWMRSEAIISAAFIAARDGAANLLASHGDWIRETFQRALQGEHDPVQKMRAGLQFNPFAIAFVGMTLLLRNRFEMGDVRTLLEAAADEDAAAARGFAAVAGLLGEIDERLPRSILRSAFSARFYARREWGVSDEEYAARQARLRTGADGAVEAELAWLADGGDEPPWPEFPPEPAQSRYHSRHQSQWRKSDEEPPNQQAHMDHQSAALWLAGAGSLFDVTKTPWLRDVLRAYASWTFAANGSELEVHDDVHHPPREWNEAYFKLAAACIVGASSDEVRRTVITPITSLPDDSFCEIAAILLRNFDDVYFNGRGITRSQAAEIRFELAKRTMACAAWHRHAHERSERIETHLGPAVAALFFNEYSMVVPAKCYLLPKGIDEIEPFLPTVKILAEEGTFLFVANVVLNLLEVSPRTAHLPVIVGAARAWLIAQPKDHSFWVDAEIGRRVCSTIDSITRLHAGAYVSDDAARIEIDRLLAALVQLGVADAHLLEEFLRTQS